MICVIWRRPLDESQETWEISHDFLVPMLDSILARWSISLWRRSRPSVLLDRRSPPGYICHSDCANFRRDPILELAAEGWQLQRTPDALIANIQGLPPVQSIQAMQRVHLPIHIKASAIDGSTSMFRAVNLTTLTCSYLR